MDLDEGLTNLLELNSIEFTGFFLTKGSREAEEGGGSDVRRLFMA